ncbi:MAG: hypothetical protein FWD71_12505, partial [Oscillospiraceae bacterium]|nr:hypothetical protein [Oscillospiraceae bacterium]
MEKISIVNIIDKPGNNPPNNSCINAFKELEMDQILHIKPVQMSGKMISYNIMDYFSTDIDTINHRLDIFDDLLNVSDIYKLFVEILPVLCEIADISREKDINKEEDYNFLQYFYYIIKLELYIDCIIKLYDRLTKVKDKVKSKGITGFTDYIINIYESEEFKKLRKDIAELSSNIKNIKSITIGINLDNEMRLEDLG